MKFNSRITITSFKPKKQKRPAKGLSAAAMARRYLELRRLRELVSEAEAWRGSR